MSEYTIEIRGIKNLQERIKVAQNLDAVRKVIKVNGSEMQRKAQRNAPVDTGALKRNIVIDHFAGGLGVKVTSSADYAPYQEWGTRYQSGTPHIKPAYLSQKPLFIRDMDKIVR